MCRHPIIPVLALTLALGMGTARLCQAWSVNGDSLCAFAGSQENPAIVSDGAGGAIVTWQDHRGANYDIYAQRVNAAGVAQWTAGGVLVCHAIGDQTYPAIVRDGSGGAIIAWEDHRNSNDDDIYAQRIDHSGLLLWAVTDGVPICTESGNQGVMRVVSNGAAGAFIAWVDGIGFRAQQVNANGQTLWGTNQEGVVLSPSGHFEVPITFIDADGLGGLVAAWNDFNPLDPTNGDGRDVFAQRLNSMGIRQWALGGVDLNVDNGLEDSQGIVSDGQGGAYVLWSYKYNNENWDLYTGFVPPDGVVSPSMGTPLCLSPGPQYWIASVPDGFGGAICAWSDPRVSDASADIYVQHLASQWTTANGVKLCGAQNKQGDPVIVADAAHGAIVAWVDGRDGNNDVYAQRVDGNGTARWTPDGVAVCAEAHVQTAATIATDGADGAIVAWQDNRNGNYDIYAKRLVANTGLELPGAPTIHVDWSYGAFQVWWTGRGDEGDSGTPLRWVVYMDGDSILGGVAHAPGVQEVVEKNWVAPCTYHDIYVRVIGQGGYRMSQTNTVSGQVCCSQQCDTERSHAGGSGDVATRNYSLALAPPRPNPAKDGSTELHWSIPQDRAGEKFQVALFDVSGRKVAIVAEGKAEAGSFAAMLRPRETASLTSGAYFLRLQIGSTRLTRSLILGH